MASPDQLLPPSPLPPSPLPPSPPPPADARNSESSLRDEPDNPTGSPNASSYRLSSQRMTNKHHQHYAFIHKLHLHKKRKQALRLAKTTRQALQLERELAVQRVKEAEELTELLRIEVEQSRVKIEEADLQVGAARAFLKATLTIDTGAADEDFPPQTYTWCKRFTKSQSSDSSDDTEAAELLFALPTKAFPGPLSASVLG